MPRRARRIAVSHSECRPRTSCVCFDCVQCSMHVRTPCILRTFKGVNERHRERSKARFKSVTDFEACVARAAECTVLVLKWLEKHLGARTSGAMFAPVTMPVQPIFHGCNTACSGELDYPGCWAARRFTTHIITSRFGSMPTALAEQTAQRLLHTALNNLEILSVLTFAFTRFHTHLGCVDV